MLGFQRPSGKFCARPLRERESAGCVLQSPHKAYRRFEQAARRGAKFGGTALVAELEKEAAAKLKGKYE
jgi:hypothetical protein